MGTVPKDNHMQTFNNSSDLLKDWDSGQGKTNELADIASLAENQLTYNGYTVEVSSVWQEAALVMYLHKELKTKPENKQRAMLDIFAQNRLSDNHKFDDAGNKPVADKPLPNHYLSSDKLRSNYFALTEADTVASIYYLLADANSSMTKDNLLSLVKSAKELIITESQSEALATLEAKESALVEAREKLNELGCFDVTFTTDKQIKCSVPFIKADTLPQLVSETLKHVPALDTLGAGCLVMSFDVIKQEG
jgi:hypothetical protein